MISVINSGVEAFARAIAPDMPRGQRINAVCSLLVKKTAEKMGWGEGAMTADEVAQYYVQAVEGDLNGESLGPLHAK